MKKIALSISFVAITLIGFAQNLITNGTFENDSMQLNCEGWVNPYGDPLSTSTEICDDFYFFIDSVENNWSLRIPTSFPEPLFTETFVTGS